MTTHLPEARRLPGSEWLKDHPQALEWLYALTERLVRLLYPHLRRFSPRATEQLLIGAEKLSKGYLFNCQMCGQCIMHSTGMTCPMTCPK
ncbi:MAG TPA: methylenetetrahydrofolate reductase C-terminal domain-containing protein, partial [Caldilineaceae bacterium]|nr:methylenetetrahydrofolate reductase C-terminal domain-containing protein [Caldilineaceae bacterium]